VSYYPNWKRAFDIALVLFLAPMLLVIGCIVSLAVSIMLGRPVIFRQIRPGKWGRPFTIFKFRTMREIYDDHGNPMPNEERVTRFGRFLRGTSLDELPEFWNVLRGDMAIVGPRPLLMRYLPRYTKSQQRRHEVNPGITGWAQVSGRNRLSWEDKFERDLWYVDNMSLRLDLTILFRTVRLVLLRDGISGHGEFSSPEFMGPDLNARDDENSRANPSS
jgi:lipopolysaccharide/colanic/teichoic acid biosynthesis glycosyltransferase